VLPDVILLDLMLPDLDGFTVRLACERQREDLTERMGDGAGSDGADR
jgi:CheY-like chemotaxis protein